MRETKHLKSRMKQRGITKEMLNLVWRLGEHDQDKLFLDNKMLSQFIQCIDMFKGKLLKVKDKGGVVLIIGDDEVGITTYNKNSYRRSYDG